MRRAPGSRQAALQIEPSDRRYHVYQSPAEVKPPEYYQAYYRWLDDHLSDVLGYLMRYPLGAFDPYAAPPMTSAKAILIEASEPELDRHVKAIFDDLPDLVILQTLLEQLPVRLKHRTTLPRLATCLKTLGAMEVGRIRLPERRRVWALREHTKYRGLSEAALTSQYSQQQFAAIPMPYAAVEETA